MSDLVVECIPAALVPALTASVVSAGKEIVMLSAGVLLTHPELVELAGAAAGGSPSPPARCSASTLSAPPPRAGSIR